jgi:hypothetical protein
MELDEIDPAKWAQLEAATQDYILAVAHKFDDAAAALTQVGAPSPAQGQPPAAGPGKAWCMQGVLLAARLCSRYCILLLRRSPSTCPQFV